MEDIFTKLAAVKKELEASMSGRNFVGAKFWKAKTGTNHIRISPAWTDSGPFAGQWWREVAQHWGVNEDEAGPVVCRTKTPFLEGSCPVCTFIAELKEKKDNPAALQLAHDLRAKKTFFVSVVDLADAEYTDKDVEDYTDANPDKEPPYTAGDTKLQVYASPPTVFDGISEIVINNKLDITKLDVGYNMFVKKTLPTANARYTKYEVSPELKPSVSPVKDVSKLPSLDKVGKLHETDEILSLISTGVGASMLPAPTHKKLSEVSGAEDDAVMPAPALGDSSMSMEELTKLIQDRLNKDGAKADG